MGGPPVHPSLTTAEPNGPSASTLEVWSPRGIGWASVFLGFPGAVVLAALNWRRMGRGRKAIVHLAAAVICTWALYFVAWSVVLLGGLAVGYYLYTVQRSDQSRFATAGRVTGRNGLAGAVIAFGASMLIILPAILIEVAVAAGGRDHRGDVLFFQGRPPDDCSPAGQATAFGPADTIFMTAFMREEMQTVSRLLIEIDGPGVTVGPFPMTARPPFDCLGNTKAIGPFEPGTYVVRWRYNGQPGTPDLAIGTFTITATPPRSPSP